MELWDFFRQPGVLQLCALTVGSAVLLLIMVWWMWYRRRARMKPTREAAPQLDEAPPPKPAAKRSGVWGAIVNFFMEPPEESKTAAPASEPGATPAEPPPAQPAAPPVDLTAPFEESAPVEAQPASQAANDHEAPPAPPADGGAETAPEPPRAPAEAPLGPIVSFSGAGRASPAEPPPRESSAPLPGQTASAPRDAVEVMRVWRDLADGSLIVDFGGQRYRHLSAVQDADLRRRFLSLVRALNQMADLEPASSAKPSPASAPPPTGAVGLQNAISAIKGDEPRPSPGMLRQLGRVITGQPPTPASSPGFGVGIVGQIEDFLQYKLQHTPDFTGRSIHIRQSVSGVDVSIEVDGHFYEGVGDVADVDVREFLQATIQEWQNRQ